MEVRISILLPQTVDLAHLHFSREQYEWEGKSHPQGFPKADFSESWEIVETPLADYLVKRLPTNLSKVDWRCLYVRGNGLDEYIMGIINPESDSIEDNTLVRIFENTLDLSPNWVTIFEINDNPIEHLFYETSAHLKDKISTRIEKGESFIVCKSL